MAHIMFTILHLVLFGMQSPAEKKGVTPFNQQVIEKARSHMRQHIHKQWLFHSLNFISLQEKS